MLRTTTPALALLAVLLVPGPASPCSLSPGASTMGIGGEVGPRPLLVSERADVRLYDERANPVLLLPATPPGLSSAVTGNGSPLYFFTTEAPLAPGQYTFDNRYAFTVTSTPSAPPSPGSTGAIEVLIDDNPDDSGFLGCAGSTDGCGDVTNLVVILPEATPGTEPAPAYLVSFESPGGPTVARLVWDEFGAPRGGQALRFYAGVGGLGEFRELDEVCVRVRGVSFDGELGEELDLGCQPTRADGAGGCAATSSPGDPSLLLLALGSLWARSRRRKYNSASGQVRPTDMG